MYVFLVHSEWERKFLNWCLKQMFVLKYFNNKFFSSLTHVKIPVIIYFLVMQKIIWTGHICISDVVLNTIGKWDDCIFYKNIILTMANDRCVLFMIAFNVTHRTNFEKKRGGGQCIILIFFRLATKKVLIIII